jgi:hypothetical protein
MKLVSLLTFHDELNLEITTARRNLRFMVNHLENSKCGHSCAVRSLIIPASII